MTVETPPIEPQHGAHLVRFYEDDSELVRSVAPFLVAGAACGEAVILIASELHRSQFENALASQGSDLAQMVEEGLLISLDAATTMAAFMPDGEIDHDAFKETIGGVLRTASLRGSGVRAYGEMVALLWDAGQVLSAIELEKLWNELAHEFDFTLFCAYPAASVRGHEHAEALHQVCQLHSEVLSSPDLTTRAATQAAADFAAEHDSPGQARSFLRGTLHEWGHADTVKHEATLILSELAANAVLHAGSRFSVTVQSDGSALRLAVTDSHPLPESTDKLVPRALHGLAIVEALSTRWGVERLAAGKVVWAELALPD
jgi:hypothetical protein